MSVGKWIGGSALGIVVGLVVVGLVTIGSRGWDWCSQESGESSAYAFGYCIGTGLASQPVVALLAALAFVGLWWLLLKPARQGGD